MRTSLTRRQGKRRGGLQGGSVPGSVDGVWLDDEPAGSDRQAATHRRMAGGVAAVVVLAAVGVPVGLVVTAGGGGHPAGAARGPAFHRVVSALNATVDSGSFDITYQSDPPTAPTTPTTQGPPCAPSALPGGTTSPTVVCSRQSPPGMAISGHGTTDTDPFAQETVSDVPGFGVITTFDNGTDLWELGGGNYGLSGGTANTSPGSPLSGFAGLVVGTLGPKQGAFDLLGLASPTGNLDLEQAEITGADEVGTSVVDGVPVTVYQVTLDPTQLAGLQTLTSQQEATIQDALGMLRQQGFTGETVKMSIDTAGFVRQTQSVASFSDGTTISGETTLSDFGCAGTIVMPGQQGSSSPPANCVSPDTSGSATTTSTAATSTTATSTTASPSTTTSTTGATASAGPTTTSAVPSAPTVANGGSSVGSAAG
jgi:hypothetical protein